MSRSYIINDETLARIKYEAAQAQYELDRLNFSAQLTRLTEENEQLRRLYQQTVAGSQAEITRLMTFAAQQYKDMQTQEKRIKELEAENTQLREIAQKNNSSQNENTRLRQELQKISATLMIQERRVAELATEAEFATQLQKLQQQIHTSSERIQRDEISALKDEIRRQAISVQYGFGSFWSLDGAASSGYSSDTEEQTPTRKMTP